ncbi:unnamed protein product [Spodoptera littoralis]|uniref:Uncharacterized protein n=1 Tax=Spodoptera littoralis TaxID=7109 RepID=A0A9P0IAW5_SPOLI|nr:unnamed protein product [Spodoptera littoralis]CAH1644587.1 unnamed protein product [Spodoptera littoralis]
MLVTGLFFLYFCANLSGAAVYDIFTGEALSDEQLSIYQNANLTETCTVNITSCDTEELRRVDGSCNNINRPAKGVSLTPPKRIVLPVFDNDYNPRKAVSGNSLPVSRDIGQTILSGYKRNDCNFTQLMTSFGMFMFWDVGALNNSRWYPGNSTLLSYQELGCSNDSVLTPVVDVTNVFDLSGIYNPGNNGDKEIRSYVGGELLDDDDINETDSSLSDECEYRRYEHFPTMPLILMRTWFVKYHNYIAGHLAALNPCWDDERLFKESREINIAFFLQTLLYEWLELFEGREHLINVGILANDTGFRDIYDETKYPTVSLEFLYISSWFLSTLDANAE